MVSGEDATPIVGLFKPDAGYVDELFSKYDDDGSGQIGRDEFGAIAEEMSNDAARRTILAMAGSALGAAVVAEYSEEYQFLQRTFRPFYTDRIAENAMYRFFPTAKLS